ncbi:MAG TPA: hypothetical protein VNN72_27320 [Polyangiaceae bacterium]|nr:hypothetical protein [Polyangiaceae bacterium]
MRTTKYSIASSFGRALDGATGGSKLEELGKAPSSHAALRAQQRAATSSRMARATAPLAPRRVGHRGK